MCLIYHRDTTNDTPIDFDSLESAMESNPDGTGLAWHTEEDGWSNWTSTEAEWEEVQGYLEWMDENATRIVLHFRYATHGGCGEHNCHPFEVGEQALLFHNGMLDGVYEEDDMSDTAQLAQHMSVAVESGASLKSVFNLAKLLVDSNRLLMTLPSGKVLASGKWTKRKDGAYSNTYCLTPKPAFTPATSFKPYYQEAKTYEPKRYLPTAYQPTYREDENYADTYCKNENGSYTWKKS